MEALLARYALRLQAEGSAHPGRIALACRNDVITAFGPSDLTELATQFLKQAPVAAVVLAEPLLPYPQLLLKRALPDLSAITPRDSESRTSLHDIPLVAAQPATALPAALAAALRCRKGCIIDGIGLAAQGALTVEQAYIAWSSLYHASFIKYLEDLLQFGMVLPEEQAVIDQLCDTRSEPLPLPPQPSFRSGTLQSADEIIDELAKVGRATVSQGLVDSFFGNISYAGPDALYISQTSARLDELEQQVDPIRYDNSSTAGITASSELPAHRAIATATGCRAVLHGHPRYPVVMSFFSAPTAQDGIEEVCGFPVVGGEGGQGGLAQTVPHAFAMTKAAAVIVRGHGVFSVGREDFRDAFAALVEVEQCCRAEYGRRLANRLHSSSGPVPTNRKGAE